MSELTENFKCWLHRTNVDWSLQMEADCKISRPVLHSYREKEKDQKYKTDELSAYWNRLPLFLIGLFLLYWLIMIGQTHSSPLAFWWCQPTESIDSSVTSFIFDKTKQYQSRFSSNVTYSMNFYAFSVLSNIFGLLSISTRYNQPRFAALCE